MNLNINHKFSFSTHDEDGRDLKEYENKICYADLRRTPGTGKIVNFFHSMSYFDYIKPLCKEEEVLAVLKWYYESISYEGIKFIGAKLIGKKENLIKVSYKIEGGVSMFSLSVVIILEKYSIEFPEIWEYGYNLYNKLKDEGNERHIKTCMLLSGEYYTNNYYFERTKPFLNDNHLIPIIRDNPNKCHFLTFSEEQFDEVLIEKDNFKRERKYREIYNENKYSTSTSDPFSNADNGTEDKEIYKRMKSMGPPPFLKKNV